MISDFPVGVGIPSYAEVTNFTGMLSHYKAPSTRVFLGYDTYIFDTHFAHMLPGIQTGMNDDRIENLSIAAVCA